MNYYEIAKRYYDLGYYDNAKVSLFVQYGKITEAEYETITGESYLV